MPAVGRRFVRRGAGGLLILAALSACGLPPEMADGSPAPSHDGSAAGGTVTDDERVRTVQLHGGRDETALPVLVLGQADRLRLAFDWLVDDGGRPLEVDFVHTDRDGRPDLLPTEYMTGFERDDLTDFQRSGSTAVPYVHYEYSFPNPRVGFQLSGNYRLRVRDGATVLFERPFYVTERLATVAVGFGTTLQGGMAGATIQPAARVTPDARLQGFSAFDYTVCFARDGRLDARRCADEPSAVDLAFFQYYLRADAAFEPAEPLFGVDLGLLALNAQVVETNPASVPPEAVLDLDYADFGGEVQDAVVVTAPVVDAAFRDAGAARTDADYVAVRFRYVPPGPRPIARPLYVLGSFNGWQPSPAYRLEWQADLQRYEATILLKQGRHVYGYVAPGGPARAGVALGAARLFTTMVYLRDPQRFTDRLVAVESAVAR